jgi:adenylate kinase family enzyme
VVFTIGPKASGKTTIAQKVCERTNANHCDFIKFQLDKGLYGQDDETVTQHFIDHLAAQHSRRIVIESFPQNLFQAKYFIRNAVAPSHVFLLRCSKDISQERMTDLGESHPNYVASSILSKRIKEFHDNSVALLPFLKSDTCFHEVRTDQDIQKSLEVVFKEVEPTLINVRMGKNPALQTDIIKNLTQNHGFLNLDIDELVSAEIKRNTVVGAELFSLAKLDKAIQASVIVKMLNRIIYSGQKCLNKFILSNFPEQIDQVKQFEDRCARVTAIIYPQEEQTIIDITNQELNNFNIESFFQKDFRLKTMSQWSFQLFQEKLGNKVEFGLVQGKALSGKTEACNILNKNHGFTVIDMNAVAEDIKKALGEDEDAEGEEIPLVQIEAAINKKFEAARSNGGRSKFVFDNFTHETEEAFLKFVEPFGVPDFALFLTCELRTVESRWAKANEDADVDEDKRAEL